MVDIVLFREDLPSFEPVQVQYKWPIQPDGTLSLQIKNLLTGLELVSRPLKDQLKHLQVKGGRYRSSSSYLQQSGSR